MDLRVISTSLVQAANHSPESSPENIDLTPWDLSFLKIEAIQQGLLFHKPNNTSTTQIINHLKNTLSSTLSFFPPLAGRLVITHHQNDNTSSCFIHCNNTGALFIHAATDNSITVSDIVKPGYVPSNFIHSLFPLNGVKNYEGTSCSLFAVQVTELVDGIFIGCAINHVVADGKSFWHFVNSWAKLSRGEGKITKLPLFQRWFPNDVQIHLPIRFPFTNEEKENQPRDRSELPPDWIFHFSKEKISRFKSKANEEVGNDNGETETETKISSFKAVLSHIWHSVIKNQSEVDPQSETRCLLIIDARSRLCPELGEGYFGNALGFGFVIMKVEELVTEGGIGKCCLEMNKLIRLEGDGDKIKANYESWLKNPFLIKPDAVLTTTTLKVNSSPRFDFYGNDFGWGKPVAVRNGPGNKSCGKITMFGGAEEGSIDVQASLPYEILEAMGNDPTLMGGGGDMSI